MNDYSQHLSDRYYAAQGGLPTLELCAGYQGNKWPEKVLVDVVAGSCVGTQHGAQNRLPLVLDNTLLREGLSGPHHVS